MHPPSPFEQLPAALFEAVISWLDYNDACILRLASRDVSNKISHTVKRRRIWPPRVFFDNTDQLQQLVALTQRVRDQYLPADLTLISTPSLLSDRSNDTAIELHRKAFDNVHLHAPHGCLSLLRLQVQAETPDSGKSTSRITSQDWKSNRGAASHLLKFALQALAASDLHHVRQLDLFTQSVCCSLTSTELKNIPTIHSGLGLRLARLERLAISVSAVLQSSDTDITTSGATKQAEDVCRFISACSSLTALHIHWYDLADRSSCPEDRGQALLGQLGACNTVTGLRSFWLEGVRTIAIELEALIEKMPALTSLRMRQIHLDQGTFKGVLEELTSDARGLQYLQLDDLFENGFSIGFVGPGKPHYPRKDHCGPNDLIWPRNLNWNRIKYRLIRSPSLGSAAYMHWLRRTRLRYGPPNWVD